MINKVGESVSFLTVFVGLNGSKEELGIQAHNCWHFTRLVFNVDFLYQNQIQRDLFFHLPDTILLYRFTGNTTMFYREISVIQTMF